MAEYVVYYIQGDKDVLISCKESPMTSADANLPRFPGDGWITGDRSQSVGTLYTIHVSLLKRLRTLVPINFREHGCVVFTRKIY
jgi:hypothetical protein